MTGGDCMKENNDGFGIFDDPLISEYLSSNDGSIRYAVSRISAECELLLSQRGAVPSEDMEQSSLYDTERSVNSIMSMCCRLMQVSELYSFLSALVSSESEKTSICASSYIKDIAERCSASLGNGRSVISECADDFYIDIPEELLTFVLLSFIRGAVSDGASDIRICCGGADKRYISVSAETGDKPHQLKMPDFICGHTEDIVKLFVSKYADTYELTPAKLVIYFNNRQLADECEFNATISTYDAGKFSLFNVLLRDINEENFI